MERTKGDNADMGREWPLWVAIVLSVLWVAAFVWFLETSADCENATASSGYLERHFGCLPPNAIGDFFAGAAAPLAFIWLVTAVLIQARELRAQRQELFLTREEFKLSRAELEETRSVLKAQAEEARRNVEFVGEQTRIMAAERKEREQEAAWEVFNVKLASIWPSVSRAVQKIKFTEKVQSSFGENPQIRSIHVPEEHDVLKNLEIVQGGLASAITRHERGLYQQLYGSEGHIRALADQFAQIMAMVGDLDERRRLDLDRIGLTQIANQMRYFAQAFTHDLEGEVIRRGAN